MTELPLSPLEHDEALAAEYVLGVLSLAERSAAEIRLRADHGFAARVASWEVRLSGLNDSYAPVPAPNLLPKIEARLFPRAPAPRGRLNRLLGWVTGMGAAGGLALLTLIILPLPDLKAPLVAELGQGDTLRFEARFNDGALTVTRVSGDAATTGQVQELWIIAPEAAPVSLGLLEHDPLTVSYPALPEGWTLAVSLEPAGGAPDGTPTGPVVAAAVIHAP